MPAPVDLYSPQPVIQADQTMAMTYQEENYEDYNQYEEEEYSASVSMDTENKGKNGSFKIIVSFVPVFIQAVVDEIFIGRMCKIMALR